MAELDNNTNAVASSPSSERVPSNSDSQLLLASLDERFTASAKSLFHVEPLSSEERVANARRRINQAVKLLENEPKLDFPGLVNSFTGHLTSEERQALFTEENAPDLSGIKDPEARALAERLIIDGKPAEGPKLDYNIEIDGVETPISELDGATLKELSEEKFGFFGSFKAAFNGDMHQRSQARLEIKRRDLIDPEITSTEDLEKLVGRELNKGYRGRPVGTETKDSRSISELEQRENQTTKWAKQELRRRQDLAGGMFGEEPVGFASLESPNPFNLRKAETAPAVEAPKEPEEPIEAIEPKERIEKVVQNLEQRFHTVSKGESFSAIAMKIEKGEIDYPADLKQGGWKRIMKDIMALNPDVDPLKMKIGSEITLSLKERKTTVSYSAVGVANATKQAELSPAEGTRYGSRSTYHQPKDNITEALEKHEVLKKTNGAKLIRGKNPNNVKNAVSVMQALNSIEGADLNFTASNENGTFDTNFKVQVGNMQRLYARLQSEGKIQGPKIAIDGDWGPECMAASKALLEYARSQREAGTEELMRELY